MTDPSGYVVRIERTFEAPAEAVFDAWTSPEVMRRWWHAGPEWETPEAEVDLRVGGRIRVVMRASDGTEVEAQGEYTLIERPHRLEMTWAFSDDPSNTQQLISSPLGVGGRHHRRDGKQRHRDGRAPQRRIMLSGASRARAGAARHEGDLTERRGGGSGCHTVPLWTLRGLIGPDAAEMLDSLKAGPHFIQP